MAKKAISDTHFFNSFSTVLGALIAVVIGLFALARIIGGAAQVQDLATEPLRLQRVRANIEPVAHVAIAGQDNAALAKLDAPAETPAATLPANAEAAYQKICSACHATGVAGAPKVGDQAAWAPRIAQGKQILYQHAIAGFQGGKGVMPARGGTTWPDDLIRSTVDYMVSQNK